MTHQRRPTVRQRAAATWLRVLFDVARRAPWVLGAFRPVISFVVPLVSSKVRHATHLNGLRICTDGSRFFSSRVVGSFLDFINEVASSAEMSQAEMFAQVVSVEGRDAYDEVRKHARGAVIVTAHMGSFEVGLAALRSVEPHVTVVFKRDEMGQFEQMRRSLRERLGVQECAIDDGWPALMRLRDALVNNEVVVMQADRAMAGQKAQPVKVLGGTLRLPVGPITLARINGSPVIPIFTLRDGRGLFRVFIEPAIDPDAHDALEQVGRALQKFIGRYPDQWLVLDPAFVEDATRESRA